MLYISKMKLFNKIFYRHAGNSDNPEGMSDSERHMNNDIFSNLISPGDLVFDVGANVGSRTRLFLELGANVISVEPQETCAVVLQELRNKIILAENQSLVVIQKALGESVCETEMIMSNASVLSTLSKEWIEVMTKSGRFNNYSWSESVPVSVTTLDKLIEEHGTPSYVKIDVEGYEYEVLKGLTKPIKYISLEFAPEFLHKTYKCIEYIESLGEVVFNYSLGESMKYNLNAYVTAGEIINILDSYSKDYKIFGDIYCQFVKLDS